MTEDEFLRLAAEGHNRIPLVRELLADLDTPLSLYLKLCGGQPHGFLLESVIGGERFGRYSFIGLPARSWLRATGEVCERLRDGEGGRAPRGQPAGVGWPLGRSV
jgi:anthranilate synthase component 1